MEYAVIYVGTLSGVYFLITLDFKEYYPYNPRLTVIQFFP